MPRGTAPGLEPVHEGQTPFPAFATFVILEGGQWEAFTSPAIASGRSPHFVVTLVPGKGRRHREERARRVGLRFPEPAAPALSGWRNRSAT